MLFTNLANIGKKFTSNWQPSLFYVVFYMSEVWFGYRMFWIISNITPTHIRRNVHTVCTEYEVGCNRLMDREVMTSYEVEVVLLQRVCICMLFLCVYVHCILMQDAHIPRCSLENQNGAICVQDLMPIVPFWLSMESLNRFKTPFWISAGDMYIWYTSICHGLFLIWCVECNKKYL